MSKAWRTEKKIVVIESDDWGAIRTSGKEAYNGLKRLGYSMEKSPYSMDALETNDDLTALYEVLNRVRDCNNNPACFTANMVMANPDFHSIKENDFSSYIFEPVHKTLEKHKNCSDVRILWKEGHKNKLFFPQLHAREHIRYWDWMKDLRSNQAEAIETFDFEMCGVPLAVSKVNKSYYEPPYVHDSIYEKEGIQIEEVINTGAQLFNAEFGFSSKTTIAPNCGWTPTVENVWKQNGIEFIQGGFLQEIHSENSIKYSQHYTGQKSKTSGLQYLVRNCFFEPMNRNSLLYHKTLKQVERAFQFKTPAIISTHRINYIGSVNEKNRENNLQQLELLLKEIEKKWPEVIFMSSSHLADLIIKG